MKVTNGILTANLNISDPTWYFYKYTNNENGKVFIGAVSYLNYRSVEDEIVLCDSTLVEDFNTELPFNSDKEFSIKAAEQYINNPTSLLTATIEYKLDCTNEKAKDLLKRLIDSYDSTNPEKGYNVGENTTKVGYMKVIEKGIPIDTIPKPTYFSDKYTLSINFV